MHQAVTETDGRRHRRKSAGPKLVFQKFYLMTSGYGKMYWMPMSSANVSRTWVMTLLRLPEKESRHSSKPRSIHATKNQPSARLASYVIGGSQPDILAYSTKLA